MTKSSGTFKFRRGDSLGTADAENDWKFLDSCFIDHGDVGILLHCQDPRCIVVGRTGSGKTALLLEVEKKAAGHTVRVAPESLSLNHIANSDAVRILSEIGVNLDPFFRLLWRHVLAIEIFQHIHPIPDVEKKSTGIFEWIARFVRDDTTTEKKAARHQKVLEFLQKHGGNDFWGDVGHRIQGIVHKFEKQLETETDRKSNLSGGVANGPLKMSADIGGNNKLTDKQSASTEITVDDRQRFQSVINKMHMRELDGILNLVAEVLEDAGQNIYIIIDKLDLQWADESVRLRLIRALMDTAIAFAPLERVKVILAMRIDLIERIYRDARHQPGTQSEKVKDYYLTLSWDRGSLTKMIDERVNKLVSDRYAPNYKVTFKDVLGLKVRKGRQKGVQTLDFILDRTWMRPRDLIEFFNACIERSSDNPRITDDALLDAEGDYSRNRMKSLSEEWQLEYPYLEETLRKLLSGRSRRFHLREISDESLCDWNSMVLAQIEREGDRLRSLAVSLDADTVSFDELRVELAAILYTVGSVGVQNEESEKAHWADNFSFSLSPNEIHQTSYLYIHDGLWKALGIQ